MLDRMGYVEMSSTGWVTVSQHINQWIARDMRGESISTLFEHMVSQERIYG